jgi:uncharacterized protein (TIGR03435 family)
LEGNSFSVSFTINGNRVTASGPLKHMLTSIYNVKGYQITGGPRWADDELYIVSAQAAEGMTPTQEQARQMLQTLFAERFELKVRRENRPLDVYALVVDGGGIKMKPSPPDTRFSFSYNTGAISKIDASVSMTSLVYQLNQFVRDRPILDETGLQGFFDFKLEWSPDNIPQESARGPSLFTAVREQLGLKLESKKAPIEMLVIDSVARPSEN